MFQSKNFGLIGVGSQIQLGKNGINLKSNSGSLDLRNSSDTAFVPVNIGAPTTANHATTKTYVDDQISSLQNSFILSSAKGEPLGVAELNASGVIPDSQLPPTLALATVGTPSWWPMRSSIPAGQIPQDGQEISRATYPDLTAMVIAGTLPVVSEATWQSDPTQRGKYTLGDGSTTIRLPDLNGQSSGSLGAVFQRGDGALSAGTGGLIQRDAFQMFTGQAQVRKGAGGERPIASANGAFRIFQDAGPGWDRINAPAGAPLSSDLFTLDPSLVARTATETRALNVTGVWTVHAFGAVVNPGSVDAAQLASDYAVLNTQVQTLQGQIAQAFGIGQSWQNVGSGRAADTNYTNSTGRMIIVTASVALTGTNGRVIMYVNDRLAQDSFNSSAAASLGAQVVVPAGSTYRVVPVAATIASWWEYR